MTIKTTARAPWLHLWIVCCLSLGGMLFVSVAGAEVLPEWKLQYLAEERGCELTKAITVPTDTDDWRDVRQGLPIQKHGQLWLRLHAQTDVDLTQSWIVSVRPTARRLLYSFPGPQSRAFDWKLIDRPEKPFQFASTVLAVELPRHLRAGQSFIFCFAKSGWVSTDMLNVEAEPEFRAHDAAVGNFEIACLAIIAAMLISALFYALTLRDSVYFWYVGHIGAFAIFETRMTYTLFRWLDGLPGMPVLGYRISEIALGVSVLCATKFAQVFLDLDQHFPRAITWLNRAAWACIALCAFLAITRTFDVVELPSGERYDLVVINSLVFAQIQNALIAVVSLVTLSCSVRIAWLGKRSAGFYLASSLPLVVGSILASVYAIFFDSTASVTIYLLPLAAFEALVLALGMADRALSLRQERDDARRRAELDPLTGQLNRRGLMAHLGRMHHQTKARPHFSAAILYCDLDYFKRVNDQYGHEAGDKCLQYFSDCAQSILRHTPDVDRPRETDVIARIGGEEFVLLLTNCTATQALTVAERIGSEIRQSPCRWKGIDIQLTVSIGVATFSGYESADAALAAADQALYRAKHEGRDRVCLAVS